MTVPWREESLVNVAWQVVPFQTPMSNPTCTVVVGRHLVSVAAAPGAAPPTNVNVIAPFTLTIR